jgi:zeaxanthin glucosyltransferase
MMPIVRSYAERNRLNIDWSNPAATVSKLAVITQTPKEFDFPIAHLPAQLHYAGPFHDSEGRQAIPFPWEKLNGKPLIYASMGTLIKGDPSYAIKRLGFKRSWKRREGWKWPPT